MGQILVRNLDDGVISAFKYRAKIKGSSLEQEIREVIERGAKLTPAEKVAISRDIRSRQPKVSEPLTRDEMREGLE